MWNSVWNYELHGEYEVIVIQLSVFQVSASCNDIPMPHFCGIQPPIYKKKICDILTCRSVAELNPTKGTYETRAVVLGMTNLTHTLALFYNMFITVLYMFRATFCSSSGGQIVLIQHLVWPLTESDDTRCCINTIWPSGDEQYVARNM